MIDAVQNWLVSRSAWQQIPIYLFGTIALVGLSCVFGQSIAFIGQAIHERNRARNLLVDWISRGLCFVGGIPVGLVCGALMGITIASFVGFGDGFWIGGIVGAPIGALYVGFRYAKYWATELGSSDFDQCN
jgi:hypothetical protein